MATAMVDSRSTEAILANSGKRRRPRQAEAEAALRRLIKWAGDNPVMIVISRKLGSFRDDPALRRAFVAITGSSRSSNSGY